MSVRLKRPSSIFPNTNIDHLPDSLLVEILCRLSCFKSVFQCKLVSKSWYTLLSDSHFIGYFLCVQKNRNQKPTGTTIGMNGEEFLNRVSPSSRPLSQLFKRLSSIQDLKQEPIVVGTYNDLVLCCASMYCQRDYYICNPHTVQWVPLPPPPQVYKFVTVGFTCDLPYFNYYGKDDQQGFTVHLNAEYKYRVVRLIDPSGGYDDDDDDYGDAISCEIKAEIFSSETGEWREFILSSPSAIAVGNLCMESTGVGSFNRMLYWLGGRGDFIIGLDPFVIEKCDIIGKTDYKCIFSECGMWDSTPINCRLVTLDGCLRMCEYYSPTRTLSIWEVNEDACNVCVKPCKNIYLGDVVNSRGIDHIRSVVFDPNDEGLLYVLIDNNSELRKIDVIRCDIGRGEISMVATGRTINCVHLYPFVLPWWPTPLRQLPQP